jgi:hypothetical protein
MLPLSTLSSASCTQLPHTPARTAHPTPTTPMPCRRCVVLLEGFYEWKASPGAKTKTPYYVHLRPKQEGAKEGPVMRMAGLWDAWTGGPGGAGQMGHQLRSRAPVGAKGSGGILGFGSRPTVPAALSCCRPCPRASHPLRPLRPRHRCPCVADAEGREVGVRGGGGGSGLWGWIARARGRGGGSGAWGSAVLARCA